MIQQRRHSGAVIGERVRTCASGARVAAVDAVGAGHPVAVVADMPLAAPVVNPPGACRCADVISIRGTARLAGDSKTTLASARSQCLCMLTAAWRWACCDCCGYAAAVPHAEELEPIKTTGVLSIAQTAATLHDCALSLFLEDCRCEPEHFENRVCLQRYMRVGGH